MKSKPGIIFAELFQVSLVTYLILLVLETLQTGFVSNFFNMDVLFFIVLVSGIVMVLPTSEKKELSQWELVDKRLGELLATINLKKVFAEKDFYFSLLISLGGGVLIYFKTQELGSISIIISLVTAVIIALLSYLILIDNK
ncbi:hypothetical protein HY025_03700 [Candidatus Daviesbacteria bacterium]|nr:hypothetical protein [Candidatus Daviesbacteria bacterium]